MTPGCTYKEGAYKYQLAAPYTCQTPLRPAADIVTRWVTLSTSGKLWISEAYAWDGASGPTIDTKNTITPSLVHDALTQLIRLGLLPASAKPAVDAFLKTMLEERGTLFIRARLWWRGVQIFGGYSVQPGAEPALLLAP